MRKPQEINVIVHYPATLCGMVSFVKQVVYANPNLLYDRIKKKRMPKEEKGILLMMAREEERKYSRNDLLFYQLAAAQNDKADKLHVP